MTYSTNESHAIFAGMVYKQLLIGALLLLLLSALGWRLFEMQVLDQQGYLLSAQRQQIEEVKQPAPRGEILDRNGVPLADSVPQYDVTFYVPEFPLTDWSWIPKLRQLLSLTGEATASWQDEITSAKPYTRVTLVRDIPLSRLMELAERGSEFPGIRIATGIKRSYPLAQATAQLLGYVGAISPAEFERLGPMGYRRDDMIGKGGLEAQYDASLRGNPGYQTLQIDHRGVVQARMTKPILLDPQTGETRPAEAPPQQGPALRTTIDAALQESIARLLQGYGGTAIVMDPYIGEIYAAVSLPSYDPNLFGGGAPASEVSALFEDPKKPMLNRFSGAYFVPGSTWKIVTALAGLEEQIITEHTSYYCDGVYHTQTKDFKCHKLTGHGSRNLLGAMADSCDDYFYQLGVGLGVDRISKWAKTFGFGEPTGIDLPGESAGLVPTSDWKRERRGEKWFVGDTIPYAIGQGYVLTTPLQMARAYALLANGGYLVTPHLNADSRPAPIEPQPTPKPENLEIIRRSLRMVVRGGTARGANFSDFQIAGKTGTADHVVGKRPHTWFASYAPYEKPQVVVVVMLESVGGKGGEAAWAFARQIYQLPQMRPYLGLQSPATPEEATQLASSTPNTGRSR